MSNENVKINHLYVPTLNSSNAIIMLCNSHERTLLPVLVSDFGKEISKNAKERKKNQLLHFEGKDSRVESIQDLDFSLFIQIKVHLIKNGDKFLFSWYYQTVYKVTKPSDFKGQFL